MTNGYRRGGTYVRNGRQFTRRGTSIKAPRGLMVAAGIGVGAAALFGSGSVLTIGVAVVGVGAVIGWRYRRQLRPVTRMLKRKAKKTTRKYEGYHPASSAPARTVRPERPTEPSRPTHPQAVLEDPDTWFKTGGDPVTEKQRYTLAQLGLSAEGMTKAQASKAIAGRRQEA